MSECVCVRAWVRVHVWVCLREITRQKRSLLKGLPKDNREIVGVKGVCASEGWERCEGGRERGQESRSVGERGWVIWRDVSSIVSEWWN